MFIEKNQRKAEMEKLLPFHFNFNSNNTEKVLPSVNVAAKIIIQDSDSELESSSSSDEESLILLNGGNLI